MNFFYKKKIHITLTVLSSLELTIILSSEEIKQAEVTILIYKKKKMKNFRIIITLYVLD